MWYPCKFLDNEYSVNELGQVKSNERYSLIDNRKINAKILKPYEINSGYLVVDLRYRNKTIKFLVHRLVYCTIYDVDINTDMVIHHKDHNRHNNNILNLDMITYSQNTLEYVNSKFYKPKTNEQRKAFGMMNRNIHKKKIAQIDLKTGNIIRKFEAIRDVNREFGYDTSAISRVCLGKQKTSYGYGWKYIDD